jgi:hypothetical protein
MTKFTPNKYLVKVLDNNVLLNAFELPATSYKNASQIAYNKATQLYKTDFDIIVKPI